MIVQLDSLTHVLHKNDGFIANRRLKPYDMIILGESESLLAHLDEKTMEKNEIEIFNLFNTLLSHSRKMLLMDGDASPRSLSFAKNYGEITYTNNKNAETNKVINSMPHEDQWKDQL